MFPTKPIESTMTGAMLGTAGVVGLGFGLGSILAISFFCRACKTRATVPRDQWNGKCPSCGEGVYKRDIKATKMAAPVKPTVEDLVAILKTRLAKGEIKLEEYNQLLAVVKI